MSTENDLEQEFTSSNNYRIFNDSIIFLDPLTKLILNKITEGIEINQIRSLTAISFPNNLMYDDSYIDYCFRKATYLKYFTEKTLTQEERFIFINAEEIKSKLANLNQITFEITDSCNLKCKYCGYGDFYEDYDERKNAKLNIDSAKKLLSYLINLWNSNLNDSHGQNIFISFYGGEPLLNLDFVKGIVDFIKTQRFIHNHITFSMTTNALLLKNQIDYLVNNNFQLLISLDGNKKNNSYRVYPDGSDSFETIFENLKYVKSRYPDYFIENINFNSVLHNRNSVSDIYNFFNREIGKTPLINELNDMGIKQEKKYDFFETYQNKYESFLKAENYLVIKNEMFGLVGETMEVGMFLHQYCGNMFHDYNDFFFDRNKSKRIPSGTCFPFGKKMFVTVNGKILPCERIGHKFALGKVTPNSVDIDFKEIAEKYNKYYNNLVSQCEKCYNVESCIQCIFNLENIDIGPVCKLFMNEKQFTEKINLEMSYLENDPMLYQRILTDLILEM